MTTVRGLEERRPGQTRNGQLGFQGVILLGSLMRRETTNDAEHGPVFAGECGGGRAPRLWTPTPTKTKTRRTNEARPTLSGDLRRFTQ